MINNFITDNTQFSWSMWGLYQQCPFKFYQKYALKRKEPSNIFGLYGCAMHELIKKIYIDENFHPKHAYGIWEKVLQKEYQTEWKQYQYSHILQKQVDSMGLLGFKHIKYFFEIIIKEKLDKPAFFVEKDIRGNYKKNKLVVKIDIGLDTKYGFTLLDWKTGEEDEKDLFQLMLYAALSQKSIGKKIEAIAPVYIKTKKINYQKITNKLKKETSEYISKIHDAILNDIEFKPKKNAWCKYCYLKEKECPLWKI